MSPNPFFLLSILISAIIAFVTMAFVVEMSLVFLKKCTKLNTGRLRALLRCIPFMSLLIDLTANSLSIGYLLNPLNCSSCVQKLILNTFFPGFKAFLDAQQISLLRYLGENTSHAIFEVVGITLVGITTCLLLKRLVEAFLVRKMLQKMTCEGEVYCTPIKNILLAEALQDTGVKIIVSKEIDVPLAAYSNMIFIPKVIKDEFTTSEFEAILAHELEHIVWKDPMVRFLSRLISSIFWWVPSSSWRTKLEFEQEVACDQSIVRYGFKEASLASAILKVSRKAKTTSHTILCYLTQKKHPAIKQRLELMLNQHSSSSKYFEWISFITVILFLTALIVCKMS